MSSNTLNRESGHTDMAWAVGVCTSEFVKSVTPDDDPSVNTQALASFLQSFDVKNITYNSDYQLHIDEGRALFLAAVAAAKVTHPTILTAQWQTIISPVLAKFDQIQTRYNQLKTEGRATALTVGASSTTNVAASVSGGSIQFTDMGLSLGITTDSFIRAIAQQPELARVLPTVLSAFDVKTIQYSPDYQLHIDEGRAKFLVGVAAMGVMYPDIVRTGVAIDGQNVPVVRMILAKFDQIQQQYNALKAHGKSASAPAQYVRPKFQQGGFY